MITSTLLWFSQQTKNQEINRLKDSLIIYTAYTDVCIGNMKLKYMYDNRPINNIKILNSKGETLHLSDLFKEDYKLVFIFSSLNCTICVDKELENLIQFGNIIGNDHIVILGLSDTIRKLRAYMANKHINIPIYYVTHDTQLGILDKENVPFLCLMNKDLKTTQLFIPIKEIQEHSEHFYRILYNRFFKPAETTVEPES